MEVYVPENRANSLSASIWRVQGKSGPNVAEQGGSQQREGYRRVLLISLRQHG